MQSHGIRRLPVVNEEIVDYGDPIPYQDSRPSVPRQEERTSARGAWDDSRSCEVIMARRPSPPPSTGARGARPTAAARQGQPPVYTAQTAVQTSPLSSVGQMRAMSPEAPAFPLAVEVECYAGYRSEESPRRFRLAGQQIEIADVVDRWLAPDHRYFKVRGAQGDLFIVRNDVVSGRWELTYFRDGRDRGASPPIREVSEGPV